MTYQQFVLAEDDASDSLVNSAGSRAQLQRRERWACDPLDADSPGDELMVTTSRRLLRLAIAAADAGARFTREGLQHDPVAWLIAPRTLFDGRPAIDACQDLRHLHRSIVLHGLGVDLDATPSQVDALLEDDGEAASGWDLADDDAGRRHGDDQESRLPRPLLLTCWVDVARGETRLFAFCGIVTDRPADLVERVVGRFGVQAVGRAEFAVGYDHSTPLATAMISDAMADTLALAAADPESPLATGLDVAVEQRFLA